MKEKVPATPGIKGNLGANIEINTEKLSKRPDAAVWLETAGATLTEAGFKYEGTLALHIYTGSIEQKQIAYLTHITQGIDNLSPGAVAAGMQQFNIAIMDRFGKKPALRKG